MPNLPWYHPFCSAERTLPLFAGLTHRGRRRSSRRWLGGGCGAPGCRKPFSRGLSLWGRRYKTDPVIAVCAIYQSIIRRREGICQGPRGTLIGNLQAPPCSIPSCHSQKENNRQPAAGGCSLCGAADGNRTRTVLPPRDFKSLASACSATAA